MISIINNCAHCLPNNSRLLRHRWLVTEYKSWRRALPPSPVKRVNLPPGAGARARARPRLAEPRPASVHRTVRDSKVREQNTLRKACFYCVRIFCTCSECVKHQLQLAQKPLAGEKQVSRLVTLSAGPEVTRSKCKCATTAISREKALRNKFSKFKSIHKPDARHGSAAWDRARVLTHLSNLLRLVMVNTITNRAV